MFDIKPEEARLLLDVAMLATGRNRFKSAAKILAALERFRPGNPSLAAATIIVSLAAGIGCILISYLYFKKSDMK